MKFTLSWLKDYLNTNSEIAKISDTLTNIGLEVENISDRTEELHPFTVAYVKNAEKHPNADRLKVCQVETKIGTVQVVCGAPNARTGMKGIFAPVGSFIPGTGITLKKSKIRDVESSGMLVSEKEMGISEEHDGIIEVDNSHKIGEPFSKIYSLDDPIFEIAITPNRGDCLSVRGISRDLAAAGIGKLKNIKKYFHNGKFESPIKWKRDFNKKNSFLCPAVAGVYFKDIKNGPSPDWLKNRLLAIGLRPISKLVDITNYITYDLGRPLHVFDADKINGNLNMRLANNNESIKALDGKNYNLTNDMVVISDDLKIQAIGGIMGGEESSCTESTNNVFLEVALFDPESVAKTGRKLDIKSDARYRFERGVDPYSIEWGVEFAIKMILELCGGEVSKITKAGNHQISKNKIKYAFNKVHLIGGIEINQQKQVKILKDLGFEIQKKNKYTCVISVPYHRPDIKGEADIVEEILRIYGYDKIKPLSVQKEKNDTSNPLSSNQEIYYKSRRLISSRDYFEVVTWSFMSNKFAKYFDQYENILKLDNPISSDLDVMRPSILPNLIQSIIKNQSRNYKSAGIFEVGPQYENCSIEGQHLMASGIKYGEKYKENWIDEKRKVDVFDIKSDIYFFLSSLNFPINSLQLENNAPKWYHPGKSCTIKLGKTPLGFFGEISPIIKNLYDIKTNVCGFEIMLDNLSNFYSKKMFKPLEFINNPYQIVERDFAFIVDKKIKSNEIVDTIKKTVKDIVIDVMVFDVFEGKNIAEDKKSIATKVVLQPIKETFKEKDIEEICINIVNQVKKQTGAFIRE